MDYIKCAEPSNIEDFFSICSLKLVIHIEEEVP